MKTLKLLAVVALFFASGIASAQKLSAENTIEISGKAKRGYLGNVVVDDARKQLDLVFVTKSTNNKVKFQVYQFDYDLKLINQLSDEQEVANARSKHNWFNFKGKDEEVITGVTAEANLTGKALFKKKEITLSYNWLTGRYKKSVKILDKMKPKTDDDKKLFFYGNYDIDEKGQAMMLAGEGGGGMNDPFKNAKELRVILVNSELDIVSDERISFPHPQRVLYNGPVMEGGINEDEAESDWAMLFAPIGGQGYGKYKDPNPTNYTFIRVGRDGKIKDRVTMTTKASMWKIDATYRTPDGTYFIYGPAKNLKNPDDAYMTAGDNPQALEKGFDNFQVAGIKDGKVLFVNAPSLDEFEQKAAKPDNQKKHNLYKGGKIVINGLDITPSGDIFINAQEWYYDQITVKSLAGSSFRGNRYTDFLMFHFNSGGDLVRCYGVDNAQKTGLKGVADPMQDPKYHPTESIVVQGADKNNVWWMMYFVSNIERRDWNDGMYKYTSWAPRKQVRMGKIDISSGKINAFNTFGDGAQGGKKFYLMNEFSTVKINGGQQVIFIGEDTNKWGMDSSGDYLWLGKFDPAKM